MSACLNACGSSPAANEAMKIAVRDGAKFGVHFFSKRPGIPSAPVALRESMFYKRFCTVCTDTGENWHSRRRSCEGSLVQRVSVSAVWTRWTGRLGSLTIAAEVSLSEIKVARGDGWDFTRPVLVGEFRRLHSFLGDLECWRCTCPWSVGSLKLWITLLHFVWEQWRIGRVFGQLSVSLEFLTN